MRRKNCLVLGSGGREHAIAWKLAQSPDVKKVYVAPGNAGTSVEERCQNVDIKKGDSVEQHFKNISEFINEKDIELTVVGPEQPLVDGVVSYMFRRNFDSGRYVFGPLVDATNLEASKSWAKKFMKRNNIPTADFEVFTDHALAEKYIESRKRFPAVVKADGLAGGKGVLICKNKYDAHEAIDRMMEDNQFGSAGKTVVVEDFLRGEEASIFALSDGTKFKLLIPSQDHKRLLDNDKGPNTGGMGAYAPAPVVTPEVLKKIRESIIKPTINYMDAEQIGYHGLLYAGVMISKSKPSVLEYNIRFGDPETQPVMMLYDSNLYEALLCCTNPHEVGKGIDKVRVNTKKGAALCVVLASEGYPNKPVLGKEITGLEDAANLEHVKIFHAGTQLSNGRFYTSGGRVLGVTAYGKDIREAKDRAYEAVGMINFEGMQFRTDIGDKAFKHLKR